MSKDQTVLEAQDESQSYVNEAVLLPAAGILITLQYEWLRRINELVPEPYLDEVFHIPQANTFWQGKWSQWDDKITTPPGLYVYSILVSKILPPASTVIDLSVSQLRWTNTLLLYALTVSCAVWLSITRRTTLESILSTSLAIFTFPLFFFFSGLYYTDIFAAVTVMITYCLWEVSSQQSRMIPKLGLQLSVLVSGLVSLTARQTNIFWVAVFTGGLQLVKSVKKRHKIHDPPLAEASFEDFATMSISLTSATLQSIPMLLLDLWPQLGLLGSFAAFVYWNGGVVLGDKSNHVAGLHFAQLPYLAIFITAMSWPLILPHILGNEKKSDIVPRIGTAILLFLIITGIVHFNTIIHPFLLADNRHYTFYAFKALRNTPWKYYALIPVYGTCAWFVLLVQQNPEHQRTNTEQVAIQTLNTNNSSFFTIWLISSSLSLITAPLVEPRYFILPWLIWRLHAPDAGQSLQHETTDDGILAEIPSSLRPAVIAIARRSIWIEILWYMAINITISGLFLYRGFIWPQEPGKVQHFMW